MIAPLCHLANESYESVMRMDVTEAMELASDVLELYRHLREIDPLAGLFGGKKGKAK